MSGKKRDRKGGERKRLGRGRRHKVTILIFSLKLISLAFHSVSPKRFGWS